VNNNRPQVSAAFPRPRARVAALAGLACLAASWTVPASANVVTEFNAIALSCIPRGGPATAFDVALMQAAVHDAVQAIEKRYEPYLSSPPATGSESKAAAAAAAAYWVLTDNRVCPDTIQPTLENAFTPYRNSNDSGLVVGKAAADALLAKYRADNGATHVVRTGVGQWQGAMTFVYAATTEPFVMKNEDGIPDPSLFRPGPPPAVTSAGYTKDYNEVKEKGSVQSHPLAGACPAPADTDMARFWAGNFGAQWNQVLRDVAIDRQLGIGDTARLLALANLAAADAGIGIWDSKEHYNFWRPIAAIREGATDGNPNTAGDASWTPFISSTHLNGATPPYPDYLSGANGLTGAYTTMLQLFFKTDFMPLAIHKASPATVPICTTPRLYRRISDVAEEVVDARVLLGIHFRFADTGARTLGTRVAWYVFTNALRPLHPGWNNGNIDD
jgi:hypothetical protein